MAEGGPMTGEPVRTTRTRENALLGVEIQKRTAYGQLPWWRKLTRRRPEGYRGILW